MMSKGDGKGRDTLMRGCVCLGIKGVVIDGRSRDVVGCGKICEEGEFVCFSKGLTSVGTGLDLRPWEVDVSATLTNCRPSH